MEILRDRREEFERIGVKPLGVSRDSPWTHISWMQALDLNFGLLSDWNAEAVQGFGVARDFRGFKDISRRAAREELAADVGDRRCRSQHRAGEEDRDRERYKACAAASSSSKSGTSESS